MSQTPQITDLLDKIKELKEGSISLTVYWVSIGILASIELATLIISICNNRWERKKNKKTIVETKRLDALEDFYKKMMKIKLKLNLYPKESVELANKLRNEGSRSIHLSANDLKIITDYCDIVFSMASNMAYFDPSKLDEGLGDFKRLYHK